jgi:hypothetical protein
LLIGSAIAIVAVLVAVIVVVLRPDPHPAVNAAGDDGATGTGTWQNPTDDVVTAIFQRRAQALTSGDLNAWLADLDPAQTALIAREKMRFANLRLLPLTSFTEVNFGVKGFGMIYKVTSGVASIGDVMQLSSDHNPTLTVSDWNVSWDGHKALLTGVGPTAYGYTAKTAIPNPPWEDVPLRAAGADNITILAPAAGRWNPAAYLPAARRAAKLVRGIWGKTQGGVPGFVIFLADHRQFTTWLLPDGTELNHAVGVTTFPARTTGKGQVLIDKPDVAHQKKPAYAPEWLERGAGSRIDLDMSELQPHGTAYVQQVMAHEMAHAMGPNLISGNQVDLTQDPTGAVVNQALWPIEGFARYVEFLDNRAEAARAMSVVRRRHSAYPLKGMFPPSTGFYGGSADRGDYYYDLGSSIFLAADKVAGRQKAFHLYITLSNSTEAFEETEMFLNPLIKDAGISPAALWATWHTLTGIQPKKY